jgi:predicted nucleic acid-binding protein
MIKRVFLDSDVLLDVALGRAPFVELSSTVLALCEQQRCVGVTSSNIVTNVYYVLRKLSSGQQAKDFLADLIQIVEVAPVSHRAVSNALDSEFKDFEDAIQYFAAIEARCDCIVTRNIEDYTKAKMSLYEPKEFVVLFTSEES